MDTIANGQPGRNIAFVATHQPALKDGTYTVTVTQTIASPGRIEREPPFSASQRFIVPGQRFTLDPNAVQAVFPPPDSLGDHAYVLPHVVLSPSTLPWEHVATAAVADAPWLVLLLFTAAEAATITAQTVPLKSLKPSAGGDTYWPGISGGESGQHEDEAVAVIDVPRPLLEQVLPKTADLRWLAHVRYPANEQGQAVGAETAVIIANRLPESGGQHTAYLVSVFGQYDQTGFQLAAAGNASRIRLINLKQWRFACVSPKQSLKGLLLHLNRPLLFTLPVGSVDGALQQNNIPPTLVQAFQQSGTPLSAAAVLANRSRWLITDRERRYLVASGPPAAVYNQAGHYLFLLPPTMDLSRLDSSLPQLRALFASHHHTLLDPITCRQDNSHWWLRDGNNAYFLSGENGRLFAYAFAPNASAALRLPPTGQPEADSYLAGGAVALPHRMRQGNRTVSWYRGPFVPGPTSGDIELPVRAADTLFRYNPASGMFDSSYAAAWELGRLLTLQSQRVAIALFQWKRSHAQVSKSGSAADDHLPVAALSLPILPDIVTQWLDALARLEHIPFPYLVPDERMLPQESLRFFEVDGQWVACLLDGAFSIGRVLASEPARDSALRDQHLNGQQPRMSGLLLRSAVVSGWPDLQVDGYYAIREDVPIMVGALNKGQLPAALGQLFEEYGLPLDPSSSQVSTLETAEDGQTGTAWQIADNGRSYHVHFVADQLYVRLPALRQTRLSANILLCLFEGVLNVVDMHLPPEALHFGLEPADGEHEAVYKMPRRPDGEVVTAGSVPVSWKDETARILNIDQLASDLQKQVGTAFSQFTQAEFALQMIASAPGVRFLAELPE